MSPIKRLIQKIAGVELDAPEPVRLRAFGKLPGGTEYVQLDAGQGPAKAFTEWLSAGHDGWIERAPGGRRGRICPTRVILALPASKAQVFIGQVWPSRDSAGRAFPFALFATLNRRVLDHPANLLAVAAQLWSHMQASFAPIFDGSLAVPSLRERTLSADLGTRITEAPHWVQLAEGIPWESWRNSAALVSGCQDANQMLRRLERAVQDWKVDRGKTAIQLPLSPAYDVIAQATAWLTWLKRRLEARDWTPRGLILPLPDAGHPSGVTILGRTPIPADVQLLTSDAGIYESIERLQLIPESKKTPADEPRSCASLWNWASGSATQGIPSQS